MNPFTQSSGHQNPNLQSSLSSSHQLPEEEEGSKEEDDGVDPF
jgi:hypothetical protein